MNSQLAVPIETLKSLLEVRFPELEARIDAPDHQAGRWFLDLRLEGHLVDVQWTEADGFGVSSQAEPGYGELSHEVYVGLDEAYSRILSLLQTKERTTEGGCRLGDLRQGVGLSQTQIADRMHCQQASISKLERRDDLRLSTLRDYVAALGGTVQIRALLPGGVVRSLDCEAFNKKGTAR